MISVHTFSEEAAECTVTCPQLQFNLLFYRINEYVSGYYGSLEEIQKKTKLWMFAHKTTIFFKRCYKNIAKKMYLLKKKLNKKIKVSFSRYK